MSFVILFSELSDLKDHNEITGEEILETKDNVIIILSNMYIHVHVHSYIIIYRCVHVHCTL